MKKCVTCKQEKAESEFNKNRSSKDGLQKKCRECQNNYSSQHYSTNKQYYKDKKRRFKQQLRKALLLYLENKCCIDCGEDDSVCLDFDHRDPKEKSFTISCAVGETKPIQEIMEEVEKCNIRCANCHRKRTAKQQGWYDWLN